MGGCKKGTEWKVRRKGMNEAEKLERGKTGIRARGSTGSAPTHPPIHTPAHPHTNAVMRTKARMHARKHTCTHACMHTHKGSSRDHYMVHPLPVNTQHTKVYPHPTFQRHCKPSLDPTREKKKGERRLHDKTLKTI